MPNEKPMRSNTNVGEATSHPMSGNGWNVLSLDKKASNEVDAVVIQRGKCYRAIDLNTGELLSKECEVDPHIALESAISLVTGRGQTIRTPSERYQVPGPGYAPGPLPAPPAGPGGGGGNAVNPGGGGFGE